jgi:predicted kinase
MPKAYILIGVPGSGKSTWANTQDWASSCAYISTDKFVEAHARSVGKTYSEVFEEIMPTAVRLMVDDVIKAREANQDVIWDQTSTTILSREKKFNMLPNYEMIAVVFPTPEKEELDRRLHSRIGKNIPGTVVENFIDAYEAPSEQEGFDKIIYVS